MIEDLLVCTSGTENILDVRDLAQWREVTPRLPVPPGAQRRVDRRLEPAAGGSVALWRR
ncbi:hypothetical protein [Jiangella ureilytica]|uniref:hypothetical protein n=1 Tax=Jiangella ureilytica TaxID=2530374 RepID=UPI0013A5DC15|nr:hypothetical protein [Jiangella ureilytica]